MRAFFVQSAKIGGRTVKKMAGFDSKLAVKEGENGGIMRLNRKNIYKGGTVMKRKITRLGVMCLALVALLSPEVGQARDTDYTTGADFSWSPYIWSLGAYRSSSDSS
ncbi:hypothetical protein CS060_11410 [Anoxybacillus flavithermus]|uniref:Uncharacterized protein n=1 Tax=Anoxybacillus flavithermus TaxID=33934 RepID=A0A2G5RN76_9BACL|nr:hypothetical protein CS060_11410 [Anoxybacillus flavithermus]